MQGVRLKRTGVSPVRFDISQIPNTLSLSHTIPNQRCGWEIDLGYIDAMGAAAEACGGRFPKPVTTFPKLIRTFCADSNELPGLYLLTAMSRHAHDSFAKTLCYTSLAVYSHATKDSHDRRDRPDHR